MTYSIIIPTLNVEGYLEQCLDSIQFTHAQTEVIVVDGGSQDATLQMARAYPLKIISSEKGRGNQLNKGAEHATGEVLIFLHADTRLPSNYLQLLESFKSDDLAQVNTFQIQFDNSHWLLSVYERLALFDSLFTRFGDQGIVVKSAFFKAVGGFPHWPLFEDVHFLQKARRKSRIGYFTGAVTTSAEKFKRNGILRQQLKNCWLFALYLLQFSPHYLYRKYYGKSV